MANWQRTLDIRDEWSGLSSGEFSLDFGAMHIANKLERLKEFDDPLIECEKEEIVDMFRSFVDDPDRTREEFDTIMTYLYGWGDMIVSDDNGVPVRSIFRTKKVCWIKTIF